MIRKCEFCGKLFTEPRIPTNACPDCTEQANKNFSNKDKKKFVECDGFFDQKDYLSEEKTSGFFESSEYHIHNHR